MTDVKARVRKHYECAVAHYGEAAVLGVFHYGSWNYGTNLPDSDVDTKCILVPDLFHLAIKPYEVKHLHVDDEVCECMTIMHMVQNWKKQNINFVEILFTDYCIINPLYQDIWATRFNAENREAIARYDIKAAVLSMSYQAINTLKQDPNDLKKIMNGARIANSLAHLITDPQASYKDIIRANETVAKIRTGETSTPDGFIAGLTCFFEGMIDRAKEGEFDSDKQKRENIEYFLNDAILDIIGERLERIGC